MARPRKTYTPEFKLAAVKMITEQRLARRIADGSVLHLIKM